MRLESNYSSERRPEGARKRRKDNEEEMKWKKIKDIECPPSHQPPTECLRGSWRIWGIEEEERGMTAGKNCSKDDENLVKLTDPCRYSWLKKNN